MYGSLFKRRDWKEYLVVRLNRLRENAETAICVGDLAQPERRKRYTSSREEAEDDARVCPCGKSKRE